MTHAVPHFTLISRGYCHLCDDMLGALKQLLAGRAAIVDVLDVDADPDLLARYDELVPVLLDESGRELCHYHLDRAAVERCLGGAGI